MKDERIVDAFDAVKPDDEAKARMLAAIISSGISAEQAPENETAAQESKVVEVDFAAERRRRQRRRRFAGIGAAACLVLVVFIAGGIGLSSSRSSDSAAKSSEIAETAEANYAAENDAVVSDESGEAPRATSQPELFASYDGATYSMVDPDDPRYADAELGEALGAVSVGSLSDLDGSAEPSIQAYSLVGFEPTEAIAVKASDLEIGISVEFVVFAISE